MRIKLLLLMGAAIILSRCATSADEAVVVQEAIAAQEHAAAMATAGSARIDLQATATASDILLNAQATKQFVEAQLTATAAPAIATAGAKRRENKTRSSNQATTIGVITIAITLPFLGICLVVLAWQGTRQAAVIRVKPGELVKIGSWIVDGTGGSVRHLNNARDAQPARTAVRLAEVTSPQLEAGVIEGVITAIGEYEYAYSDTGQSEAGVDRRVGELPEAHLS